MADRPTSFDKKFNNASRVQEIVWDLRLSDFTRGENRAVLDRLYDGFPPFKESEEEENQIQINVNDLEGVNLLSQARRQWNQAMLKPGNAFTVRLDCGPAHKRDEHSHSITKHLNSQLKKCRKYIEEKRATGANTMLHGIGPVNWPDRRFPIPTPIPISSLLIPSETDIDFENLEYFAVFREWTPAQLYMMTHGPRVDPGWNMPLVKANLAYVAEQYQKQPNATAYQYMPERVESLLKEDLAFWGTDSVPTVDAWDFLYRKSDDGLGWYRAIIPDWGAGTEAVQLKTRPTRKFGDEKDGGFLYTSGNRKYANSLSEILHCQFGDCSAVAPFKYHSVRSLGWMLWGVCDLQNRLHCKFNEAVFESLMWFFRTAGNQDLIRLRKAVFSHMGAIPQGITIVPNTERYVPNEGLINMAFSRNRQLMSENAASFTQDFDKGQTAGKEMTATETMARVNSVNALVSGMLALAYTYEEFKDREVCRRFCIKNSPVKMVQEFRLAVLKDGVPEEYLDVDRWIVERERVLGAGNKTLEMASVQFLQQMRNNLSPDAQRMVDHIAIESATDQADLAERLAPISGEKHVSNSMHDAELAVDRLMRGLPYQAPRDAVAEDYVQVWLRDLAQLITAKAQGGNMATQEEVAGFANIGFHITQLLDQLETDDKAKERTKAYRQQLGKLENAIKGFGQRLAQQAKAAQKGGNGGLDPKDAAKIQGMILSTKVKAQLGQQRSALREAHDQARFEADEARKNQEHAAEMQRENLRTGQELAHNRLRAFNEPEKPDNA